MKKKKGEGGGGKELNLYGGEALKKTIYIRFSLLGWPTIKCLPDVDGFSIEIEQ